MRPVALPLVVCSRLLIVLAVLSPISRVQGQMDERREFFETRIRPILVQQCYECHNSSSVAEGELAVDDRAGLRRGGQGGSVIVPGMPEQSRLLGILRHETADLKMPKGGPRLDDSVIADFEKWIREGAVDPRDHPPSADELQKATSWEALFEQRRQWWSFQPIQTVSPPDVPDAAWSENPIDRFVFHRMTAAGLTPAAPADAPTIVRRLYFVLTGLPPGLDEQRQWTTRVAQAPNAESRAGVIEQLTDQLLASPQFGECWARHWMDWIRYADSHGSEGDPVLDAAWRYRDYLIRALNSDVGYDQLVREHVAGDLLPAPRLNTELQINESAIGPAHFRMVFHGFAPTDALDERVRFMDDQINAFSKAFLGLTISCARCHDHKFDAISQKDYYALYGILNSCRPARRVIDLPGTLQRNRVELQATRQQLRQTLADAWLAEIPQVAQRLLNDIELLDRSAKPTSLLHVFHLLHRQPVSEDQFAAWWSGRTGLDESNTAPDRGAVRSWDLARPNDVAAWFRHGNGLSEQPAPAGEFTVSLTGDQLVDRILPAGTYTHLTSTKDAGRLMSPDLLLDGDFELWLQVLGDGGAMARYVIQNYPRNGTVYPVRRLNAEWRWERLDLTYWRGDLMHVELCTARDAPLLVEPNDRSWFGIRRALLMPRGLREPPALAPEQPVAFLAAARKTPPSSAGDLARCFATALRETVEAWRDGRMSDAQAVFLHSCLSEQLLPNSTADIPAAGSLVARYRQLESEVPVPVRVPGIEETVAQNQPLYVRGNHKQAGDTVSRRFLEAIDDTAYDDSHSGRRHLAEDLLRSDNPLTRRVIVNRLWHHVFGHGLVETPDNLGRLGHPPTHPDLLDWLALRLSTDQWSLKRMIRQMVTSRTWQQDSVPSALARRVDPDNRLWSHMSVRRLNAEAIRDSLRAVSGTLDDRMYGPPAAGSSRRRSVYVEVRRNALDPFLRAFDFPEPFSCTGRRDVTNVPAQSLTLINAPEIGEFALSLSSGTGATSHQPDRPWITDLWPRMFGREATAAEISDAERFLEATRADLQQLRKASRDLQQQISSRQQMIEDLLQPVRARLQSDRRSAIGKAPADIPKPVAAWDFETDARDHIGQAHAELRGGARLDHGGLVLDGKRAHAVTAPLPFALREKTLEAWVQLDGLDQRGGGVMTVQSADGQIFDSIVYAEQSPGQWLSGSNVFERTRPFQGPKEKEAGSQPIHLAIVYHGDGRIAGYRNGVLYGTPYVSSGPRAFAAGSAVVSFGVRHLPASGNRLLAGRILEGRLFDRALTAEQVRAAAESAERLVTESLVLEAMSAEDRTRLTEARRQIDQLQTQLAALGPLPESPSETPDETVVRAQFIRSLFCFKEFVYLR